VTKRLFLVRHCESTGQEALAPLTTVGQAQAVLLADHLETVGVDLLVSSPYTRAQQSVAPLARRLGLPVEIDTRLAERVLSAAPLAHWQGDPTDLCGSRSGLARPGIKSHRHGPRACGD
jgi:2,3-bisphosphoglycerate-dependent phosphoglycerate mutase